MSRSFQHKNLFSKSLLGKVLTWGCWTRAAHKEVWEVPKTTENPIQHVPPPHSLLSQYVAGWVERCPCRLSALVLGFSEHLWGPGGTFGGALNSSKSAPCGRSGCAEMADSYFCVRFCFYLRLLLRQLFQNILVSCSEIAPD